MVARYAGQKNKSKHVKSELNPEFEFSTGYVIEEGGPSKLTIGKITACNGHFNMLFLSLSRTQRP